MTTETSTLWRLTCCGEKYYEGYDEILARRLYDSLSTSHQTPADTKLEVSSLAWVTIEGPLHRAAIQTALYGLCGYCGAYRTAQRIVTPGGQEIALVCSSCSATQ